MKKLKIIYFILPLILILNTTALKNIIIAQTTQNLPDDSLFYRQKRLFTKLKVIESWKITKGSPDIIVGVIDNGFDFFHPDLESQLTPGYYASGGYHTEIYENIAHGTLVASIIGAKENNKIGIAGLAPGCKILTASLDMIEHKLIKLQKKFKKNHPDANLLDFQKEMMKHQNELKEFGKKWSEYQSSSTAEAIRYLVDHGVKVINISGLIRKSLTSSPEAWSKLENAFDYAENKNVLIVMGAGNNARKCEDYPGKEKSTIVVGAATLDDKRWVEEVNYMKRKVKIGYNYGERLTVVAPPESIVVCIPHEKRFYFSEDSPMGNTETKFKGMYDILPEGATSSATSVVTSLAALIYSLRNDLDPESVVKIIKKGCDDIGEKGYDTYTGYGRINFLKTLKIAKNWEK